MSSSESKKIYYMDQDLIDIIEEVVHRAVSKAVGQKLQADDLKSNGSSSSSTSSSDDSLLTSDDTARELDIQPPTLATWRYQGKGPEYIKIGSKVRYRRSAIAAFLKKRQVKTT